MNQKSDREYMVAFDNIKALSKQITDIINLVKGDNPILPSSNVIDTPILSHYNVIDNPILKEPYQLPKYSGKSELHQDVQELDERDLFQFWDDYKLKHNNSWMPDAIHNKCYLNSKKYSDEQLKDCFSKNYHDLYGDLGIQLYINHENNFDYPDTERINLNYQIFTSTQYPMSPFGFVLNLKQRDYALTLFSILLDDNKRIAYNQYYDLLFNREFRKNEKITSNTHNGGTHKYKRNRIESKKKSRKKKMPLF